MSLQYAENSYKPLDFSDFGASGINGSVDRFGRIVALNSYHERHGYVTLTVSPPFTEGSRYDSANVRHYRAALAAQDGCGYSFAFDPRSVDAELLEDAIPHQRLTFDDDSYADCITFAVAGGAIQHWNVNGITPRWQGKVSLQRCAYTQITEGGPLPPAPAVTTAWSHGGIVVIYNPALPHAVAIIGLPVEDFAEHPSGETILLDLPARQGESQLIYGIGSTPDAAIRQAQRIAMLNTHSLLEQERSRWQERWREIPDSPIIRRGFTYSLAMGIPVGEGLCLLTDHMLLPLSWNRDSYYAARALLSWRSEMYTVVRRHLLWMFEQAERHQGAWARCYLANGKIKDAAFQLDQQLFPLLELVEYTLETGDHATYRRLHPYIAAVMEMLLARRDPAITGLLLPTDETPADDPIHFPYHLSSHLLLLHLLNMLHRLDGSPHWQSLAAEVQVALHRHFITERDGIRLFAYAIDGRGQFHLYHDANDLPLVLAPYWGLLSADDPVWQATLTFAFSTQNIGGFYDGHVGSVHTRAPWALGDLQALIRADLTGDTDGARLAWSYLCHAAQWDGGLPEAYAASSGQVIGRHWFAWPNAALAWYALERNKIKHRSQVLPLP